MSHTLTATVVAPARHHLNYLPARCDLVVADTAANHPKGVSQAYADIGGTLSGFSFDRVQGSLYLPSKNDLANLFAAITALKRLPWFSASVRVIRAFEVEHLSDSTQLMRS